MPTQRYKVVIAYRGTRYHGWQHQDANAYYHGPPPKEGMGIPTIQETVSRAIVSFVGHPIRLIGSSRTDAGVHAKGQLAHFDTDQVQIPPEGLRRAVNARLPDDIIIRSISLAAAGWDAIASTISKRYQYFVWNAPERPVFFADLAFHRRQKLDVAAMVEAAKHLVGTHDFASFARPGHGRENTVRSVLDCTVSQRGPRLVIGIEGGGFLWNMVRIVAGTLVEVGVGRFTPDDIPHMLAARDRQTTGSTAPAHGLYLQWVKTAESGLGHGPPPSGDEGAESGREAPAADAVNVAVHLTRREDAPQLLEVAAALPQWFTSEALGNMGRDLRFQAGFKAMDKDRVAGFVTWFVDEGIGTIGWLGVRPELHRKGVGRRLLTRLIAELRRGGIPELRVHTLGEAADYEPYARTRAFYRALGFVDHQRIAQPDNPSCPERLIMRRRL